MTAPVTDRRVEHAGGYPVVDLTDAPPSSTPTLRMMELARRHGPAFVERLDGRDTLVVGDAALVEELADEERFAKSVGPALENVRGFAGDGLFTAYNDEPNWAAAHGLLMPAFALGSMRTYHPVMVQVARRVTAAWDRRAAAGTPVDVAGDMTRMTLDTIGLAGFGFDFGSFERDAMHPFVDAMVRCLEWAMTRRPDIERPERDAEFRSDADFLAAVVDEVIAARADAGPAGEASDLLGLMLQAEDAAGAPVLSRENIRNQVITFLIAGHETTSGALSFALHALATHPGELHRVQQEVDALWGADPDPDPSYEDIGRLRRTRQVLNEALRLWPTAPGFIREARADTLLGGVHPVRAGESVRILTPVLHRQPVWGDNPELFDPDRFSPEAEAARSPHVYKPFGTGERACIGRQFALHEATMLLGLLVHRYRLIDHADYRLAIKQTLTLKPDGFTLQLLPRTAAERCAAPAPAAADDVADDAAGRPTRVRPGTSVLLLHGSNYGACREFAEQLAETAAGLGAGTEVAPLDSRAGVLPADRPVVIAAASYNGRPTDDAARFVEWLEHAEPGAADGVRYAVLGVGDRTWAATYQHIPTLIDRRLAELGATRLLDRAAADVSGELADTVAEFTAALRGALLDAHGDPDSAGASAEDADDGPAYTVAELPPGGPLDALAARHGTHPMAVVEARDLTPPGHPRRKRYLKLRLPEGVDYRTADHLSVLPVNDPALVERALRLLGADPDTLLSVAPGRPRRDGVAVDRPVTARQLLAHCVELQDRLTVRQVELLAGLAPCPPDAAALRTRGAEAGTLLDLVDELPSLRAALTWPLLLELLPPIRPRRYSVSSSPAVDGRHVELMVSLLDRGGRRGTGSGYLCSVRAGDVVQAAVQPCREAFRLAPDPSVPVVMVAAGTGLAPFRGAVADRVAALRAGRELAPALLYFGCTDAEADLLHGDELRAAEAAGAVSLRPAFSGGPGGRHVQDRLAAEADEVRALVDSGAVIRVCGDGAGMAPGVRAAFAAMGCGDVSGSPRYAEDVYAAR